MFTLAKITSDLFPKLYDAFLVDDDPLSTEQDWRNVFDYAWDTPEGHCGYAMLHDGEVVGMLGMVFADRHIDGRTHRFCNLHTWWVREDHRGRSLLLLKPLTQMTDYTITHFTPCDKVRAISRRLGFEEISTQLRVLLPLRMLRRRVQSPSIIDDHACIAETLDEPNRRIFDDHQPYNCGHLLIEHAGRSCYLLYTHVVRHRLPYCHIHYLSDRDVFAEKEQAVRRYLLDRHQAKFVALDRRLVGDLHFERSFDFWSPANGLYRSSDLQAEQIDNLYSDIVFLKLTTLPDITHELTQLRHRWRSRVGGLLRASV